VVLEAVVLAAQVREVLVPGRAVIGPVGGVVEVAPGRAAGAAREPAPTFDEPENTRSSRLFLWRTR
jgi:hypothetical protein